MELSLGSGYQATGNTNVGHYLGGLGVIGDEPYILGKFDSPELAERRSMQLVFGQLTRVRTVKS